MTESDPRTEQLQRELDYLRRELNTLGTRYRRLEAQSAENFRESMRSRTLARLVWEIFLATRSATPDELAQSTLTIIGENMICDRVALLKECSADTGCFKLCKLVGLGQDQAPPATLKIQRPPEFMLTRGDQGRLESAAAAVRSYLGTPYILWTYDRASGYALIAGNFQETNVHRPFEESDRDLLDRALALYVDLVGRHREAEAGDDAPPPPAGADEFLLTTNGPGLQEADIKRHLRDGGRILKVVVVEKVEDDVRIFTPFFATSWRPGYSILRTWKGKADKTYKDLSILVSFVRATCHYDGPVTVYSEAAPEVRSLVR
ncbi:hypothetical protein E9232_006352 [Inquilinus ginsengisoli]|uniref:GAF domain-containing protein n=1 Tax=Inquilinus ginsengisoli TaxID=363840 RepID=A0ABU1JYV8_9PROT|nr:hypothetical protein [Inquilinus ginsengisoli]MDR6293799.1 hypothetical protein [Inquilinus ginsengisoli]